MVCLIYRLALTGRNGAPIHGGHEPPQYYCQKFAWPSPKHYQSHALLFVRFDIAKPYNYPYITHKKLMTRQTNIKRALRVRPRVTKDSTMVRLL